MLQSMGWQGVGHDLAIEQQHEIFRGSQMGLVVKNLPANAGDIKRRGFNPWVRKIPWKRTWQPTPEFLPEESHGQRRSLAGYSPWGNKEWDTTERLSTAQQHITKYYRKA